MNVKLIEYGILYFTDKVKMYIKTAPEIKQLKFY